MRNWHDEGDENCLAEKDLSDAQAVCDFLDIPLQTVDFSQEYWDKVFNYFLDAYSQNLTPNPDILCNQLIKFECFLRFALSQGAHYLATGHYARVGRPHTLPLPTEPDLNQCVTLLKGLDSNKDQSYFLCQLSQYQLQHSIFPLGNYTKPQVRALAKECGLPNHDRPDSTGICFIGERKFREFLSEYLLAQPGPIKSMGGQLLGEHTGLIHYTPGQRKGIGIGGKSDAGEDAWYVAHKDVSSNTLYVVQGRDHDALMSSTLQCMNTHWISQNAPDFPLSCHAKIRHRQADQACTVTRVDNGVHVIFDQPQRAIAPGQYIVLYQGDECLGGGVITTTSTHVHA